MEYGAHPRTRNRSGHAAINFVLFISLYTVELSALVLALTIPRLADKPTILSSLASRPGAVGLMALSVLLASSMLIVHNYGACRRSGSKAFALTLVMNLTSLGILVTAGELAMRIAVVQTHEGLVFLGTPLLPRSWGEVAARNHEILKKAATNGSYLVVDDLLGWTVGPNRRSVDGLNFSSAEGLRSPRADMAFADFPATYRIALVGDSYTFGLEVKYEDSWGYQLERALGPEFQVLNFGVSGYGLDQAYLRYYRDVRPWQPDVVIFGVFPHDLERTMTVYTFISFPEWEYPFAKPRFITNGDQLMTLNVPLLPPEAIFSKNSITELPFLEYDKGYKPSVWQWRFYHRSYVVRYLMSRYPRWQPPVPTVSDVASKSVNSALLRSFLQLATAEGSTPIVVYLPARIDLHPATVSAERGGGFARDVLNATGINYTDLTPCLLELPAEERFVGGIRHYTPAANAAVARCLRPLILKHLSRMKSFKDSHQHSRVDGIATSPIPA